MDDEQSQSIEVLKKFGAQIDNLALTYTQIADSIISGIKDSFARYIEEIQKSFSEKINSDFIEKVFLILSQANQAISDNTRQATILLGEKGWYVSLDMPLSPLVKIGNQLSEGQTVNLDKIMSDYFRSNSENIINAIVENFPDREKIIRSAFTAHRNGDYDLSIPVFLSQADGICYEIIGIQLYSRAKGKPKTIKFVDQFSADSFMNALLEPFRTPLPISASKKDRIDAEEAFNRHAILHGESCDYGSEINSLKAISLLNYISQVLAKAR